MVKQKHIDEITNKAIFQSFSGIEIGHPRLDEIVF